MAMVDNVTSDGDFGPFRKWSGKRAFMFWGDLGAATVKLVFQTKDNAGVTQEAESADLTFSGAIPDMDVYQIPEMDYVIRVTGSDASTDFGVQSVEIPS